MRIFDTKEDMQGNKIRVLNAAATQEAQMKQQQIEDAFKDWIWKDPTRRQMLVKEYNERFNSLRPREYDGSHILFHGMSPEITLRPHQKNAIAHILYGGNTLLAHVVGAGKTYEMVAAAMEKKRLGLCTKTLICVPNHLTEQLAGEALQLYPNANILVARKTDFEKANRKRFCAKIATGNYDIIVIGHSQFERIPLSQERQVEYLQSQIHDVINQVAQLKEERAENFTVKQMERMRKQLEKKLDKLNDQSRKDDVVTFEQLGVDSLMVDEAHAFKNLAVLSKMRNVAGISQTESQRASDLYMKCRYLDEITGSRGVVFATGTPISNSMAELFTMQRYLQRETLEQHGLSSFDAWASTFGETVTAVELAPEGTGYRTKTRFSKFYNLPELMSMFKQVADVQTADMLNLPVPKLVGGKPINVALPPSPQQKQMVADLADRAEEIRAGNVDPTEDNMLKVTNDGRKLALDQRLIDPNLPENPNDKVHACAENVYRIWSETKDRRLTQLVFCDLSTPKPDGFNVYHDLRNLLISMGIPENEVQFIHSANTEVKKAELFAKVRSGDVRVLMGSTGKMGAGITMLYTQLFDQLFRLADSEPKFDGALPVHVRFMMDEFANVALPANFKNILAVCRSRNISCDIILQSKSQIQSLYKDDWEGMIGNCDSLIYLGGNEYATFEWLSKYIGKMTERTKSQSIGRGSRGSSSDSYQLTARDLCSPDEIRRMDDGDCLVLLRSEPPVIDRKFDLMRHPNVKLIPDGGAAPYRMPDDYAQTAQSISPDIVTGLTEPAITDVMYEEIKKIMEEIHNEQERNL